jgi:hypothetical protein
MNDRISESAKAAEYGRGYEDAKRGDYSPPEGSGLTDFIFGWLDELTDTPSTTEYANATSESYRQGHSAGSK